MHILCFASSGQSKARNTHTTCGTFFGGKRCFPPLCTSTAAKVMSSAWANISHKCSRPRGGELMKCWDWFMAIIVVCLVLNKNHNLPHLKLKTNTLRLNLKHQVKRERERVRAKSRDNTWSPAKCPDSRRASRVRERWNSGVLCLCFMRHLADNKSGRVKGPGELWRRNHHQQGPEPEQHQLHLKQRRTCSRLAISSLYRPLSLRSLSAAVALMKSQRRD